MSENDALINEIRNEFAFDEMISPGSRSDIEKRAIFDSWLAERDRQVAERAWDEAVEETHALGWLHDFAKSDALTRNPHRKGAS